MKTKVAVVVLMVWATCCLCQTPSAKLHTIEAQLDKLRSGDDYDVLTAASLGGDEPVRMAHHRLERQRADGSWLLGDLFVVDNPREHLHVLEPLGGCGNQTRELVSRTMAAHGCALAMNGGYFRPRSGRCLGNLVSDAKVVQAPGHRNAGFGLDKRGAFHVGYVPKALVEAGHFEQLVTGVVWLVRDGHSYVDAALRSENMTAQATGGDFVTVQSARTAIGVDRDGRLLLCLVNGKTWQRGIDLYAFAELLIEFGAVAAVNLDGGGSATFVDKGVVINYPSDECSSDKRFHCERKVSSIVCIK